MIQRCACQEHPGCENKPEGNMIFCPSCHAHWQEFIRKLFDIWDKGKKQERRGS